jgi:hypothetical protein
MTGSSESPEGDGYGTVTVDANGLVSFTGTLADGTKVTQKGCVSKNGEWPLYVSLYSGRGSVLGWLLFTNRISDDMSGKLSWIYPPTPTSHRYPAGFEVDSDSLGSCYAAPVGTASVLEFTDGVVVLSGGSLSGNSTNDVTLGPKSKVTDVSPNKLAMSFTSSSGYFFGTNQSGRVVFRAAP